ncbi:MAG: hypothetical protein ABSF55_02220, partial [Candidatus Staskawiczbacteria bacterium]
MELEPVIRLVPGTRTCSPSCAWSSCQGSCTSGQTNPYFKCQNSICTVFNQCGTTNCSTCGGVYVSKCNPNGTCSPFGKGRPCNNSSDCSLTHCDENQQCVHGGTGPSCTSSVHCANDSTCGFDDDGNTECLAGDGGAYCSTANDCNFSAGCDINQQCVPGGIYGSCDPTNGDTDCQNATSCDYDPTSG